MTTLRAWALVVAGVLIAGCVGSSPVTDSTPKLEEPRGPAPDVSVSTGASPILATFSRLSMVMRVLPSGQTTKSMMSMLVLFQDGAVEIRDGDPKALVIAKGTVDRGRLDALRRNLGRPEWKELVATRGETVPDGAKYVFEVQGNHVTRYGNPDDEAVVREATAEFNAIWKTIDP